MFSINPSALPLQKTGTKLHHFSIGCYKKPFFLCRSAGKPTRPQAGTNGNEAYNQSDIESGDPLFKGLAPSPISAMGNFSASAILRRTESGTGKSDTTLSPHSSRITTEAQRQPTKGGI